MGRLVDLLAFLWNMWELRGAMVASSDIGLAASESNTTQARGSVEGGAGLGSKVGRTSP